jgi:F-type H+-transporting ATPase subunit b
VTGATMTAQPRSRRGGLLALLVLWLGLLLPALAFAQVEADEEGESPAHLAVETMPPHGQHPPHPVGEPTPVPWNDMLEAIVNFGIFAFLLVYFLKRPIATYFEKRSDRIAVQLDEAARLNQEAAARLDEYERRLAAFDKERDQLFENVRKEAESERDKILTDARRHAERLRHDTEIAVAYEIKRAQQELRERIVDDALAVARRVLAERLDPATQDRLVHDYMAALAELKSEPAS